jgi:hypothetical protein
MQADAATAAAVEALIRETYRRMSTPGSDPGSLFDHPDIAVTGSGQGEVMEGPELVGQVSRAIAEQAFEWSPSEIRVWCEADVAWARILGHVTTRRDGIEAMVPYWTTGVFVRDGTGWRWRYWGGAEPQVEPRV